MVRFIRRLCLVVCMRTVRASGCFGCHSPISTRLLSDFVRCPGPQVQGEVPGLHPPGLNSRHTHRPARQPYLICQLRTLQFVTSTTNLKNSLSFPHTSVHCHHSGPGLRIWPSVSSNHQTNRSQAAQQQETRNTQFKLFRGDLYWVGRKIEDSVNQNHHRLVHHCRPNSSQSSTSLKKTTRICGDRQLLAHLERNRDLCVTRSARNKSWFKNVVKRDNS